MRQMLFMLTAGLALSLATGPALVAAEAGGAKKTPAELEQAKDLQKAIAKEASDIKEKPPTEKPMNLARYAEGDEPVMIMPIIYALVGVAGISVVGFKNPKRTHLD